jgi:hypothetical protein
MADSSWASYVGMVTGVIGAVMGYIGYRRSNEIKSLDLRLEYRKSINDYVSAISKVEKLLPYANNSRERVAAGIGNYHSGAMQHWKQEYEADSNELNKLAGSVPSPDGNYDHLTFKQLESKLVEMHKLQNEIKALVDKYQSALDADDKTREYIRSKH